MRFLFTILVLLVFQTVHAQKQLYVQSVGIEQGISQRSVLALHQDPYGFIWMGTRDGLNEYDGTRTKVFKHVVGDSLSIAGNYINDITDAGNGNLWIAHNKGISLLIRKKNIFRNIPFASGNVPNPEIRSVTVIDGTVWACGWSGIYVYDPRTNVLKYPGVFDHNDKIFLSSVAKIKKAPDSTYWIATANQGLVRYKNNRGQFQKIYTPPPAASGHLRLEDILFQNNGRAYLATYKSGIYECNMQGTILRQWYSAGVRPYHTRLNNTRTLALDHAGRIWIGGFQGLAVLDPETGGISEVNQYEGIESGPWVSIRSLLVDKNGSVWAGTYHNGAILYDKYLSRFKTIPIKPTAMSGHGDIVSGFAYTPAGSVFVSTENGHIFQYDSNEEIERMITVRSPKTGNPLVIKSLYYDSGNHKLWIGTLRHGLYSLEGGGEALPVKLDSRSIKNWESLSVINGIQAAKNGLWLLTDEGGGLNLFSPKKSAIIPFPNYEQLHAAVGEGAGNHILSLGKDTYLLSCDQSGVIFFTDKPGGMVSKLLPEINDVNHITYRLGKYYLSTNNDGLVVLDDRFSMVKHYTTKDGLLNNTVLNSFVTDRGEVWANTFSGISHLNRSGRFVNYHIRNGFPLAEINACAFFQSFDSNHPFLAGGKNAWVIYGMRDLYNNPYLPRAFVTDLKIDNQSVASVDTFENFDLLAPAPLTLKHNQNTLTFEFVGLNYLMSKNNTYRYKMEGYDEDWKYADHQGTAGYSKLPPGKYEFRLQAANNDGIWNKDEYVLPLEIRPPFWQTWQACLLYALAMVLGILLIRRSAVRKATLKRNLHLKDLEQEKAALAYDLKVKYFTDISHEIRTPLTLILSPMEELMESDELTPEDKAKIVSMRYHGRNLLLLINQLLEINRVEHNKENLVLTPVFIKDLCDEINEGLKFMAAQYAINFTTDTDGATEMALLLDGEKTERIILNLLTNAFKYTPGGGSVHFKANTKRTGSEDFELTIEVKDTGLGISEKDLPYIFDRFFKGTQQAGMGTGIGLSLVKAIVENLMHGEIRVSSKVNAGSYFIVTLPGIKARKEYVRQAADTQKKHTIPPEYLACPSTGRENESVGKQPVKGGENVMVVEDNPALRKYLVDKLSAYYAVYAFERAEDAISELEKIDFDLIISDIMLPGMSGKDFCAMVKSNLITSHIPVFLLTAIQDENYKIDSLETGADDYLTKPFVFKELLLRIHNMLQQKERLRMIYKSRGLLPEKQEIRLNRYDRELLQSIEDLVEKHLDNAEYSIEQLGKDAGLSRVHLYRKLKKLTGQTPSQFVRNYRLKKAIEILAAEDIRVSELAFRVGFNDQHYFVKCFKQAYGVSPTEYVNQP